MSSKANCDLPRLQLSS